MTAIRRRSFFVFAVVLAAIAVGVLLLYPSPEDNPGAGRALHRGLGSAPDSFDPHKARSVQAATVLRDIGEALLTHTPGGELTGGGAETWSVSDDGLVYRFRLRETARWSNGEPVTAADFVYSFRRLVDPATAAFSAKSAIPIANAAAILAGELPPAALGVRAVEARELEIRLARATPYFLSLLAHTSTQPVYSQGVERHGDAFARPGRLVTNGPYRLSRAAAASLVVIERNPYYWNASATAIAEVRYHVLIQPAAQYNRFRAGELDIADSVPTESFASIRARFPDELKVAPRLAVYYYGFNLTRPPFAGNRELRAALSMAIDRDVLVERITGRGEVPAYSLVPPGIPGYAPPTLPFAELTREERLARARRHYRAAGYSRERPARIELRYNSSDTHQRIAEAVQIMWRDALGVATELINEEFQVLLANMRAREVTQVFRSSWSGEYPDAHTFLSIQESADASNLTGFSSAEYDGLMQRAAAQTDPDARRRLLEQAERALLAEHPLIPLYYYVSKYLVSRDIEGWQDTILDHHYSHHLSFRPSG